MRPLYPVPAGRAAAIETYVRPQVIGRAIHDIEDGWSVFNNAMSGLDMALEDIKSKLAAMSLDDLLSGCGR